ncbi:MAG: peptide chain release factor N(5)-glutamine methyltransferase [Clostridia bacterium]|nr:peptide chain release factor N(5)-glutamine methyltransferase [Clostridia bacterium]
MTYFEVLKQVENELKNITEDYSFDSWCLFSEVFQMNKTQYVCNKNEKADEKLTNKLFELAEERKKGEPLQYLIGKWNFLDNEFYVGKGVLIPRADTECLVEEVAKYIENNDVKVIYDLCSGSGCVGISLAKMFENITVYLVEISEEAINYLEKNVVLNDVKNVRIINGDIFDGCEKMGLTSCDVIVSNPPYIRSDEIQTLQKEVRCEPQLALDGGKDGLVFYRELKTWFDKIENCKFIAMECAEDQAEDIKEIFNEYKQISYVYDLNKIKRDVCVEKRR